MADRVVFAASVGKCLRKILPVCGFSVWPAGPVDFSYQLRGSANVDWLKGRFECWKEFREESLRLLTEDINFVVTADISGFYENIDIYTLMSDLRTIDAPPEAVDQLSSCLNRWAHIRGKSIPQGHSASDILAKVYLNAVDAELRDLGYRHVRYVDDFRMFCRSRSEAAKALLDLSRSLRKRGLVLNSAKSQFHPAGEARQNIDGAIPVIEGVRENIVQMITDALGANYVDASEARSVLGASVDEIPVHLVEQTFEQYFMNTPTRFSRSLFHFLLHRLTSGKSTAAVDYCLGLLRQHPEETEEILRYIGAVSPTEADQELSFIEYRSPLQQAQDRIADFLDSSEAVYPYQIYQAMEWSSSLDSEPSSGLIKVARRTYFDTSQEPWVRSACIKVLADFGSTTDLARLESSYSNARNDLERAELVCALGRLESTRRNEFYGRVRSDSDLNRLAVRWIRGSN